MNLNVYIHSGRIATYNIRVRQTDSISDRTLSWAKQGLHTPICVAMALRGAWAEHVQKKSTLRGM